MPISLFDAVRIPPYILFVLASSLLLCGCTVWILLHRLHMKQRMVQRYQTIFACAPVSIMLVDAGTMRILHANRACLDFTGYSHADMLRLSFTDIVVLPAKYVAASAARDWLQQKENVPRELAFRRRNGEQIHVEAHIFRLRDKTNAQFCLVGIDTTERKQVERALLQSIPDNVIRVDSDAIYRDVRLAGDIPLPHTAHELIGRSMFDMMPEQTARQLMEYHRHALQTRHIQTFEYERELNGEICYLESRVVAAGENEVIAVIRNVTERRKQEGMLRYQASLVENANDAIISTDLNFRLRSWNRAAAEQYGRKLADVIGQPFNQIVDIRYPNRDRDAQIAQFERGSPQTGLRSRRCRKMRGAATGRRCTFWPPFPM